MLRQLIPSALLTLMLTILCGLAYPLSMTQIADRLFPTQAHGSLIAKNDHIIGSALIGQNFTQPQYLHPRPSATTQPDPQDSTKSVAAPYNAASSGASNLALSSKAYREGVETLTQQVKAENPKSSGPVPIELVTSSASGLDPDLTPDAAKYQAPRIADARRVPLKEIDAMIDSRTRGRLLGIFGVPTLNVLEFNLALDERWPRNE